MAKSAPRLRCRPRSKFWVSALSLILCTEFGAAEAASDAPDQMRLQLEVTINDQPTHLIAEFIQLPDSRIAAKRSELAEIGIKTPSGPDDYIVPLSEISGLNYKYDVAHQSIDISVPDTLRLPHVSDAKPGASYHAPQRTTGAFLNYTAFLAGSYGRSHGRPEFDGGSLSLDGHLFGPFGAFSQSGIIGTTTFRQGNLLRLDTTWSYSDPDTILSYRAGDLITGGLAWTRPIRIGGFQLQRNFNIRPDLITMPLPSLSGSVAVPSTLDVYVGNLKTYSTELPSGPYRIDNMPVISGAGTALLVLTDATGRQVESESPFFTDARLLRKGLVDYSIETGFPRSEYGLRSSAYESAPVITASIRDGLTNHVTLEGHLELGRGLTNAGMGVNFSTGLLGLISAAGAFSNRGAKKGALFYGAWDFPFGDFNLHASTQRTIGDYQDIASLPLEDGSPLSLGLSVPRAIDQIAVGYRFPDIKSSVSLAAIHTDQAIAGKTMIVTASFSHSFENGMSIFASGFRDAANKKSYGAFVGLAIPLGATASSFVEVTNDSGGNSVTADVVQAIGTEPGSFGGRFSVSRGHNDFITGYGAVRLRGGLFEASITQQDHSLNAYLTFSGALVASGNGIFTSQRIDDAFAVVDAGASGVSVFVENHPVGVTGSSGKLLVTGLKSYQENNVSIDASALPLDADVPNTELRLVPAERSGVVAKFVNEKSSPSAEVIFTQPDGSFVNPGARGTLHSTDQSFVVGYDGRAFIRNLSEQNAVTIILKSGPCQATFPFVRKVNALVTIGPVPCR